MENNITDAEHAARDLREVVDHVRESVKERTTQARKLVRETDAALMKQMQTRPLVVLAVALGVGYVLGRVVSKLY